jgi:hypothetical protein
MGSFITLLLLFVFQKIARLAVQPGTGLSVEKRTALAFPF